MSDKMPDIDIEKLKRQYKEAKLEDIGKYDVIVGDGVAPTKGVLPMASYGLVV